MLTPAPEDIKRAYATLDSIVIALKNPALALRQDSKLAVNVMLCYGIAANSAEMLLYPAAQEKLPQVEDIPQKVLSGGAQSIVLLNSKRFDEWYGKRIQEPIHIDQFSLEMALACLTATSLLFYESFPSSL